jgi:glycerophosphoryl diester phosphodiesterase
MDENAYIQNSAGVSPAQACCFCRNESGFLYSKELWLASKTIADSPPSSVPAVANKRYERRQQLLKDFQCQMIEDNCPGPFTKCDAVIAHRGASWGYPEHTMQAYSHAIRMGACKLSCEATLNKDNELFCRQDRCDLHYTTDILTNPDNKCLAKKCSTPFTKCCTSDFNAEELKRLCVVLEMNTLSPPPSPALSPAAAKEAWKPQPWKKLGLLDSTVCPKIMSHKEFIKMAVDFKKVVVTELLDDDRVPDRAGRQAAAKRFIEDYENSTAGIVPTDVFLQSQVREHVETWLSRPNPRFVNVGLRVPETQAESAAIKDVNDLRSMTPPLKFMSASIRQLLQVQQGQADLQYGDSWTALLLAKTAKKLDIKVWAYGYNSQFLMEMRRTAPFMTKDTDAFLMLHGLLGIAESVFTDWPETVSAYDNCISSRNSTVYLDNEVVAAEWVFFSSLFFDILKIFARKSSN